MNEVTFPLRESLQHPGTTCGALPYPPMSTVSRCTTDTKEYILKQFYSTWMEQGSTHISHLTASPCNHL